MICIVILLLGLVFGSFVNAFVWRMRAKELLEGTTEQTDGVVAQFLGLNNELNVGATSAPGKKVTKAGRATALTKSSKHVKSVKSVVSEDAARFSIVRGRSMCPNCHHELAAKDLVPVVSWLMLKGKCRYCSLPISRQYPLVEILTAVLFAASYWLWPLGYDGYGIFHLVVWLVFVVFFVALSVYDFKWYELPDRVVWPLVALAALQLLVSAVWLRDGAMLIAPLLGAAVIFGLFYIIYQISKGRWIGGGDVKLGLVLGMLAGSPLNALLVIFFASVIGMLMSIPTLLGRKNVLKTYVPFGPALMLGLMVVLFFGEKIIGWYQSLLT